MRWRKVAILGVGLLGGSLGMAIRFRGLAGEVHGFVRREATAREAVEAGAVDVAGDRLSEAVSGADLVVLCTPVARIAALAAEIVPFLEPRACVTDVGSVKGVVVDAAEGRIAAAGGFFVGSHPMAGSERTGVGAARRDLFEGALTVVTPTSASREEAVALVRGLWESVGSKVSTMTPGLHDELVGRSSHLPHLVAVALAQFVLSPSHPAEQASVCATGFRDTTRVASGSPEMWRDIALGNRVAILSALEGMEGMLGALRKLLEAGDGEGLEALLRSAKDRRDAWCGGGAKSPVE
ncbi:MAG: prephenate dehydrogenase [Limisphaerales bacterium]